MSLILLFIGKLYHFSSLKTSGKYFQEKFLKKIKNNARVFAFLNRLYSIAVKKEENKHTFLESYLKYSIVYSEYMFPLQRQ